MPHRPSLRSSSSLAGLLTVLVLSWGAGPGRGAEPGAEDALLFRGAALSFTVPAYGERTIEYRHPGGKYLAFRMSLGRKDVLLCEATGAQTAGEYFQELMSRHTVEGTAGPSTLLDTLPQAAGTYRLRLANEGEAPAAGTLELVNLAALQTPDVTEPIGTLMVRKGARTTLTVEPDLPSSGSSNVTHPRFDGTQDVTPGGDVIMSVPAGLWKLVSSAEALGIGSIVSRFVPVVAGKTTVVEGWPIPEERTATATQPQTVGGLSLRQAAPVGADVRVRFSTPGWKGEVERKDVEAFEGGSPAEVLSLTRSTTPLRLVLLLDSSGSMKGDMAKVLEAAAAFVKGLPADTQVDLVDFDTRPKPQKAMTRAEVLKTLPGIKADGATALNDAVILGVKGAAAHDRAAVVLFTDGFDFNFDDTGPGSVATPDQMFQTVQKCAVPVFTIGYGKKPDDVTLRRLAALSGGVYSKAQAGTVATVFDQVRGILGREFELVYRRPAVTAPCDTPVICVVQDKSGSMNMPPDEEKTCGYRMEEAKDILRSFVRSLPDGAIAQVIGYSWVPDIVQVWTSDKALLQRGISELFAYAGTETTGALDAAYRSLKQVPSSRRYLLFITDAALPSLDDDDFKTLAGAVKDAGIDCTWVGMVGSSQRGPFDAVAKFTGGVAAVSEEPDGMRRAVEQLGKRIVAEKRPDPRLEVRLVLARKDERGRPLVMSGAGLYRLPPSPEASKASVQGVHYRIIEGAGATEPSTGSAPGGAPRWVVDRRMELRGKGANKALVLTPRELLFLQSIRGLPAPDGERLVALGLQMENTQTETAPGAPVYEVACLRPRVFLAWNESPAVPASPLTWLGETPLVTPDDEGLSLRPKQPTFGYLVFRVPAEGLTKAVLTFYDDQNGHVTVPVVGDAGGTATLARLPALATTSSGPLGEGIEFRATGLEDRAPWVEFDGAADFVARTVEFEVRSAAAATLVLEPGEAFLLQVPTTLGPLWVPASPLTETLPLGWRRVTRLVPGAAPRFRVVFLVPRKLGLARKGALTIVGASGVAVVALDGHGAGAAPAGPPTGSSPGLEVRVNRVVCTVPGEAPTWVDATFTDLPDGRESRFSPGLFLSSADEPRAAPSEATGELLFGLGGALVLPDGGARRGCVRFEVANTSLRVWSKALHLDHAAKPRPLPEAEGWLVAQGPTWGEEAALGLTESALRARLQAPAAEPAAEPAEEPAAEPAEEPAPEPMSGPSPEPSAAPETTPETAPGTGAVTVPALTRPGADRWAALLALDEAAFLEALQALGCVPGADVALDAVAATSGGLGAVDAAVRHVYAPGPSQYGPAAVLTQGWGTAADLTQLAADWCAARALCATREQVTLTPAGREAFVARTGWPCSQAVLPALVIGAKRLVVPFGLEHAGLVEAAAAPLSLTGEAMVGITVRALVVPASGSDLDAAGAMGGLGGSMGGTEDETPDEGAPVTLLEVKVPARALSADAADLCFLRAGSRLKAVLTLPAGEPLAGTGEQILDLSQVRVTSAEILIQPADGETLAAYRRRLATGESLDRVHHTLGVGLPDLTQAAGQALEAAWKAQTAVGKPSAAALVKGHLHAQLGRFLAWQSRRERSLAAQLDVKAARAYQGRVVVLTAAQGEDRVRLHVDLRRVAALAVGAPAAVGAFQVGMGLFNATLEETLFKGEGLVSWWGKVGALNVIHPSFAASVAQFFEDNGVPAPVVKVVRETKKVLLFPDQPRMEGDQPRWAWFEVDPETYAMTSVLDDGSHGAAEQRIMGKVQEAAAWGVGFFIGTIEAVGFTAAFSLAEDDWKLVLQMAAKACGDMEGAFARIGTKPKAMLSGVTMGPGGLSYDNDKAKKAWPGFIDGYRKGCQLYFATAAKAASGGN